MISLKKESMHGIYIMCRFLNETCRLYKEKIWKLKNLLK